MDLKEILNKEISNSQFLEEYLIQEVEEEYDASFNVSEDSQERRRQLWST